MDTAAAGTSTPTPQSAGEMLRAARDARGLSLDEVAARTRVPLRHLQAIEGSDYGQLPSPTYAVGFAKAFARAVGADEVAVAGRVREEVARLGRRTPDYTPYEVADPSRVPSRGVAVLGIGAALAVLILAVLWFGTGVFRSGPAATEASAVPAGPVTTAPVPAARPATPTGGQVTLAATDEVWLRVYDADGRTLYTGNMKPGERFDVPAGARDPRISVGRPDKLQVTLNGSAVPPLGSGARPIKGVKVSAAAVAARLQGAPAPTATPSATPEPVAAVATPTATPSATDRPKPTARPTRQLTETQRANLASARAARRGKAPPIPQN